MLKSRLFLAMLTALALSMVAAVPAGAAWTTAETDEVRGIAPTDGGDILILRQAGEATPTLAVKPAGSSVLAIETLPAAPEAYPLADMRVAPSGDAVISYGGITVLRTPDGALSDPIPRWNSYAFDASPSGAMAWLVGEGGNVAVRMRMGGELRLRTTTLISGSPACLSSRLPQLGIDGRDRAVIAWHDCRAPYPFRVATLDLATGEAGPVQTLVAEERTYPDPTYRRSLVLDVNPAGDAIVAWPGDANQVVRVTRKAAGDAAFGPITEFPGRPIAEVFAARVDRAGGFHIAWAETGAGAPSITRVGVSAAAGAPFTVSEVPGAGYVRYDRTGGAVAGLNLVRPPGGVFGELFTPSPGREDLVSLTDDGEIFRVESPAPTVRTPGPVRISRGTTAAGRLGTPQTVACSSPRKLSGPTVSGEHVLDVVEDAGRELLAFSSGGAPFRVLPVGAGWVTLGPSYRALAPTGDAVVALGRSDGSFARRLLLRSGGSDMAGDGSPPDVATCDGATPPRFALTLVPEYEGLRVAIDCPVRRAACQGRLVLFAGVGGVPTSSAGFRVEPGRRGTALLRVSARLRDQLRRGERPPLRVVAYDPFLRTMGVGRLAG